MCDNVPARDMRIKDGLQDAEKVRVVVAFCFSILVGISKITTHDEHEQRVTAPTLQRFLHS